MNPSAAQRPTHRSPRSLRVLYVDVDGTLVGPGGNLLWNGSTAVVDALVRARGGGLEVVPVSGRGRVQVFELCRLLGLNRGVAELGCVHVDVAGHAVRYELGGFPFKGETPVEAMVRRGAVEAVLDLGLEPFDRWNEGRVATYLLRADVAIDVAAVNARLTKRGFGWCELVDNGRAYHLAPRGTGKAFGVRADRTRHALDRADVAYVGDSSSDLACAPEVSQCWLVANAPAGLVWPERTAGSYGDGVAEVIDDLLRVNR